MMDGPYYARRKFNSKSIAGLRELVPSWYAHYLTLGARFTTTVVVELRAYLLGMDTVATIFTNFVD